MNLDARSSLYPPVFAAAINDVYSCIICSHDASSSDIIILSHPAAARGKVGRGRQYGDEEGRKYEGFARLKSKGLKGKRCSALIMVLVS